MHIDPQTPLALELKLDEIKAENSRNIKKLIAFRVASGIAFPVALALVTNYLDKKNAATTED